MKISLIWSLCFLLIFMIQNVLEKKTNQRNLVANWSLIVRLIILVTDAKNCDAFGSRWNAVVITIWTNVVRRRCLDKVFVVLWWPTSCVYLLAGLSKAKTYETYLIYTGLARIPWLSNCKPGGNPMLLLSSGTGDGPCRMIQNRKKILVLLWLSQPDALLISDQETFPRKFFTRARFNCSLLYVSLDREVLSKENNFKRLSKAWQPWSLSCNNWNIRESLRHTFRVRSIKAFKRANLKFFVNLIIK